MTVNQEKKWLSLESPMKYPKNPALEKNGCRGILSSWKKSKITQKIQPWRKMVVAEFFHHGQNPRSLKKSSLGEKWLLRNSSIMDKIYDLSKNPALEKNGCCGILPSWTKSTISQKIQSWRKMVVAEFFHHGQNPRSLKKSSLGQKWLLRNSSIMDKIHDHSKILALEKNRCCGILPSWTKSTISQKSLALEKNYCCRILPSWTTSMTTQNFHEQVNEKSKRKNG